MTTCFGVVPDELCPLDAGLTVVHAASRTTATPVTASCTAVRVPATDVTLSVPALRIYEISYMIYDSPSLEADVGLSRVETSA